VRKSFVARWRSNFLTGLVIVLPAVISIGALVWLFGSLTNITDRLLFFLKYFLDPKRIYVNGESGPMFWHWSLLAFLLAICLICAVGVAARNYIGKKIIEWMDTALLQVPFLNKIYGATKQVNDALTSGDKNSFKTVVMIEFPHPGTYAIGFITSEHRAEPQVKAGQNLVCVFVPTTPNPTSGFLVLVPEKKVTRLEMSVADGVKYIISLGAIAPIFTPSGTLKN
jgi:uncharacterized membrane protein